MSLLFLDIETYVSKENEKTGLNPYMEGSKVITIAYNYYEKFTIKEIDVIKPLILKEWDFNSNGEETILRSFYDNLKNKIKTDRYVDKKGRNRCNITIIGFNHLEFDLPYLLGRLCFYKIDSPENIYENLFLEPMHTDLMQLTQLISTKSLEYEKLIPMNHKLACEHFKIKVKDGEGKDLSRFYDAKDYELILKYIDQEFSFEKMYFAFIDYIKNKNISKNK